MINSLRSTNMATIDESGLIRTIEETDDIPSEHDTSDSDDEVVRKKKKIKRGKGDFNLSFQFSDGSDKSKSTINPFEIKVKSDSAQETTLDEKISKARRARKQAKIQNEKGEEEDMSVDEEEEEEEEESDEEEMQQDTVRNKLKRGKRKREEEPEKVDFSESIDSYDDKLLFQDMNLSRPLLKGLSSMNFVKPTPIQSACIPVALMGKDICACAVTGSGKTVAFMLPILERLLFRPKAAAATRVLILLPTRELAVQVHTVGRQLAQHINIDICLAVGGLDLKAQEAMLRLGPDIVIATPGRLIDHLHNSPSFTLHSVEILVLDEADRMLDEYFAEQMKEVIRMCARQRQTMLFSATMSEMVKDLVAVSLKDPVKVFVNSNTDVALGLRQEFIRIRPSREGDREAIVAALVSRNFRDKCMVFIQTKIQAHRMHILLGLLGVNVGELHGNLSQPQRLETLKKFKDGLVDVLLATDLAARGLDIDGVKTVINFTMPSTVNHYIHRVGRTARAGKSGRSVTLVGERERKVLKEVVKEAKTSLKTRVISHEVISRFSDKISEIEDDIRSIQAQEKEESHLRSVENKMNKAQNLLDKQNNGEVDKRREWFQTHKERKAEQEALRLSKKTDSNNKKVKKPTRKKLTSEDRANFEMSKAELLAMRSAKKSQRPKAIRAFSEDDFGARGGGGRGGGGGGKGKGRGGNNTKRPSFKSSFEKDLADVRAKSVKKHRAGPSYKERLEAAGGSKDKANAFGRKKKR